MGAAEHLQNKGALARGVAREIARPPIYVLHKVCVIPRSELYRERIVMCRDRAMSTGEGIVRSRRRPSIRGSLRSKARSAPPAGGGGGIMAGLQTLLQAFPNLGLFSPSFSKESFGGFVGFQRVTRVKNLKSPLPNFFRRAGLLLDALTTSSGRIPPAGRREGPRAFSQMVESVYAGRWRSVGSSWSTGMDREKFYPSMISDYRKAKVRRRNTGPSGEARK